MKISIGADHAGYPLKAFVCDALQRDGFEVIDHGAFSSDSVDYPDFAHKVAADVKEGLAQFGVLICSTGIGMAICANKVPGIRAALVHNEDTAQYSRLHNNANVICLGAKYTAPAAAKTWIQIFIKTAFLMEERHSRRIEKLNYSTPKKHHHE